MKIGTIDIDKPVILAPMEDVTDTAFRIICKRLGADIVYTEFTSSDAIIRDSHKALDKIKITQAERPIAIQLFGGSEDSMSQAAGRAEGLEPDFIDINCGCWVKNIVAHGCGAALLKDLPRFEKIVTATVKATRLPVTVKTRLGWDTDSIIIEDVARMVEGAGAKAIAIHCRTRSQAHSGKADWQWLEKIKKAVEIPVIGNGDVATPEDVEQLFAIGCDGVMIGRGAISNPWIFCQAKHYLTTRCHLSPPTLNERINRCIEHLRLFAHHNGAPHSIISFRKYYAAYLKGIPHIHQLRQELMQLMDLNQIIDCLHEFMTQEACHVQSI